MSTKLEEELAQLVDKRFVDNPYNYGNLYSGFFESNKDELKNPLVWEEMRNQVTYDLEYMVRQGKSDIVNKLMEELIFTYTIWSKKLSNAI